MFYCTECTDDVNMLLQTFDFFEISQRHLSTVADIAKFLSGHRPQATVTASLCISLKSHSCVFRVL